MKSHLKQAGVLCQRRWTRHFWITPKPLGSPTPNHRSLLQIEELRSRWCHWFSDGKKCTEAGFKRIYVLTGRRVWWWKNTTTSIFHLSRDDVDSRFDGHYEKAPNVKLTTCYTSDRLPISGGSLHNVLFWSSRFQVLTPLMPLQILVL